MSIDKTSVSRIKLTIIFKFIFKTYQFHTYFGPLIPLLNHFETKHDIHF